MRITNKYYVDKNGDMVGYPNRYYGSKGIEVPAEPFHAKLKIIEIGWLNSGFCIKLQDENGKMYNMNNVMFKEYLTQSDTYLEGDWNFYKQGNSFSIGL